MYGYTYIYIYTYNIPIVIIRGLMSILPPSGATTLPIQTMKGTIQGPKMQNDYVAPFSGA